MRSTEATDQFEERLEEIEKRYPIDQGYYHMAAGLNEGATMDDEEAKSMFSFTYSGPVPDPIFKLTEITEDYVIVVAIDRSKIKTED